MYEKNKTCLNKSTLRDRCDATKRAGFGPTVTRACGSDRGNNNNNKTTGRVFESRQRRCRSGVERSSKTRRKTTPNVITKRIVRAWSGVLAYGRDGDENNDDDDDDTITIIII